jgi:hypothetical protein
MKNLIAFVTVTTGLFMLFIPFAGSNQADDTTSISRASWI